jgi:hypothetical protein
LKAPFGGSSTILEGGLELLANSTPPYLKPHL